MTISFKNTTTLVAILFFCLCLVLLFIPSILVWIFQIDQTNSSEFIGRRAAMLFLGFGTLALLSRNSRIHETQRIIATSIAAAMAGLALLGLYEFISGGVGVGIFLAIIAEVLICAAYAPIIRRSP